MRNFSLETYKPFVRDFITHWEGLLSLRANDNGNWFSSLSYKAGKPQVKGVGKLIGSKYGVTGAAYARFFGLAAVDQAHIASLTLEQAVSIAIRFYIDEPNFECLAPNRVTLSAIDMGWGAGPVMSIKLMQRMIGVADDGKIGQITADRFEMFCASVGEQKAAAMFAALRNKYYDDICASNPNNREFLKGWKNRTAYYLPGSPWWQRMQTA